MRRAVFDNRSIPKEQQAWTPKQVIQQERTTEEKTKNKANRKSMNTKEHATMMKLGARAKGWKKREREIKAARLGTGGKDEESGRWNSIKEIGRRVSKLVKATSAGLHHSLKHSCVHALIAAFGTGMSKNLLQTQNYQEHEGHKLDVEKEYQESQSRNLFKLLLVQGSINGEEFNQRSQEYQESQYQSTED